MHILILSDRYPPDPGGLAVSTRRLARGLARAGHNVEVSAPDAALPPGVIAACEDDGIRVHRLGPHKRKDDSLADWFELALARHSAGPLDLIHGMYITQPSFVAVTAARYLQIPSVISARGNDLDRSAFDPGRFSQMLWALEHASAVTAVSGDLVRRAQVFAPGQQTIFVPNAVDAGFFVPGPRDPALAAALDLDDRPVVAFVGEARRKKGLTVLLPAFASLAGRLARRLAWRGDPAPALLFVGGVRADDAPILDVFCRQNPALSVRVVADMPHQLLPPYYRLADVLVVPSLHDGMPNALLEGMACGCAAVASNVGGIPDLARHDETALLVPPGDVEALAEALERLLCDPERRARLGQTARAVVAAEFTEAREIERNLAVYRQVGAGPGAECGEGRGAERGE